MRIAGYAAIFDRPDASNDVIEKGAFRANLQGERRREIPLLLAHRPGVVAGHIEMLAEDRRGLRVIARVGDDRVGREVKRHLRAGTMRGLSFGYRVRRSRREGALRRLDDLDLVEVSLVARPMQSKARVHAIEE